MLNNGDKKMQTKKDFEKFFRAEILPEIREQYERDNRIDCPARREAWNNIIDAMVTDNELPKRAINWSCPW